MPAEDDALCVEIEDTKRLTAERFRRIWGLVEDIARHPGKSRKQMAAQFALSQRQLQADLSVIRCEMGLPLVRHQGYRFSRNSEEIGSTFSLAEAELLLVLLRRAAHDPSLPINGMQSLLLKLPYLFPLHLRPLVAKTLETVNSEFASRQREIFAVLVEALLRKSYVRLHYAADEPVYSIEEPIVQPEVLFQYLKSWYLIGTCRQRRRMMVFELDSVVAVMPSAEPGQVWRPANRARPGRPSSWHTFE